MNFRTEITIPAPGWNIDHHTHILSMGSCFAEHIGKKLEAGKFPALTNPLGIVFHPEPLIRLLNLCLESPTDSETLSRLLREIERVQDDWVSFNLHSRFSGQDRETVIQAIHQAVEQTHNSLLQADLLILTLGTAWGWRDRQNAQIVANCHRAPASRFEKVLSQPEHIFQAISSCYKNWKQIRPNAKLLLTVSPVIHTREGLPNNSLSKAVLRVACHLCTTALPDCYYFPAFEILKEDLRDYRFYKEDLIHPNEQAIAYIWDHFARTFFDQPTQALLQNWEKVRKDMQHRPRQANSQAHLNFLKQLQNRLETLSSKLNVSREQAELSNRIENLTNRTSSS